MKAEILQGTPCRAIVTTGGAFIRISKGGEKRKAEERERGTAQTKRGDRV